MEEQISDTGAAQFPFFLADVLLFLHCRILWMVPIYSLDSVSSHLSRK